MRILWVRRMKKRICRCSGRRENGWIFIFTVKIRIFTPSLKLAGSPFRLMVWEILKQIPYGTVLTYGEIADMIAEKQGLKTMSAQAVGGAVGHNPISVIVPCHRVVGRGGSLTGYAGGIDKKIRLLRIENVDLTGFFVPKKGTAL